MSDKRTEACGRCAMSTVVETTTETADKGDSDSRDPFGSARIEVDERSLRRISPAAWMGRLTSKLDRFVQRLTYGR